MSRNKDESLVSAVAVTKPAFVIKVGETYYTTLALWEYDPLALNLTAEQKRGIDEVKDLFADAQKHNAPKYDAYEIIAGPTIFAASSRP